MAEATVDRTATSVSNTAEDSRRQASREDTSRADSGGLGRVEIPGAVAVPAIRSGHDAHRVWRSLAAQLQAKTPILLDMADVRSLERGAIAALIRFLKTADRMRCGVTMVRLRGDVRSMLELIGVHHLVEFGDVRQLVDSQSDSTPIVQKTQG
ncbi:MAG: STAS domain-containing protein [Pirellulaceae bacterium]|nr:STAS domain-containing protein [Pirellulaceae bacterium]